MVIIYNMQQRNYNFIGLFNTNLYFLIVILSLLWIKIRF
jgi:hypothetical protein